ncbi:MAG TPA: CPXCG motif-containing cysteine-rich protein [Bacteroidota bacterium]|nr:CPXCG motif-containing cysteine-rich protein [Bacteroidota bacterium]
MILPDLIPARYDCPSCGESNEILIDPTGGEKQEFVEDCSVCCRPAAITVRIDPDGFVSLGIEPGS